jgi:hypothetical protein
MNSALSFPVVFFRFLVFYTSDQTSGCVWAACLGGEEGSVNVLLMLRNNIAFSLSLSLVHKNASHVKVRHEILRKDSLSADGFLSCLIEKRSSFFRFSRMAAQ